MTIPNSVTSIGDSAFYWCDGLISVTIGSGITSIAKSAFGSCKKLTTLNVSWSKGEVKNAPWGATNATINYDYIGE